MLISNRSGNSNNLELKGINGTWLLNHIFKSLFMNTEKIHLRHTVKTGESIIKSRKNDSSIIKTHAASYEN